MLILFCFKRSFVQGKCLSLVSIKATITLSGNIITSRRFMCHHHGWHLANMSTISIISISSLMCIFYMHIYLRIISKFLYTYFSWIEKESKEDNHLCHLLKKISNVIILGLSIVDGTNIGFFFHFISAPFYESMRF